MNERESQFVIFQFSQLALPLAAAVLLVCGCSAEANSEDLGTAVVSVTNAPADGTCIKLTAQGSRTVTQAFDVNAGASTVFNLHQLPAGNVVFSATAFGGSCAAVAVGTEPNWVSDPVPAHVVVTPPVNVLVPMRRNGRAAVAVDFDDPVCGNGAIETGEQCDDGNLFDLDGCDSSCKYEVVTRFTALNLQGASGPSFCAPSTNVLGTQVFASPALNQVNTSFQSAINGGSSNTMMQFLGLSDPTGANATGFSIGFAGASLDPAKGAWPGTNPIDWWFLADRTTVANGLPTNVLTGDVIGSGALTAGPGNVNLFAPLFGQPQVMEVRGMKLAAAIAAGANVPAPPPSQLAAGLTVFQTITGNSANQGFCGNLTVESLAQVPVPDVLTSGALACGTCAGSHTYTSCGAGNPVGPSCNSLLDVIVGGCKVSCLLTAVNPTQPDVPSNGAVQVLSVDANNKVTNAAGNMDGYSSYWGFAANRAHFTAQTCVANTDCQQGQTCAAGKCQ